MGPQEESEGSASTGPAPEPNDTFIEQLTGAFGGEGTSHVLSRQPARLIYLVCRTRHAHPPTHPPSRPPPSCPTRPADSARAAVTEVVKRGVADPARVSVGGHSYGAFMTANLVAHAPDLFAAGEGAGGRAAERWAWLPVSCSQGPKAGGRRTAYAT